MQPKWQSNTGRRCRKCAEHALELYSQIWLQARYEIQSFKHPSLFLAKDLKYGEYYFFFILMTLDLTTLQDKFH